MPVAQRKIADPSDFIADGVDIDLDVDEEVLEEDREDTVASRTSSVQSGWAAALKTATTDSKFTTEFRFNDEPQLMKFLDATPFAVFRQHWIERAGRKSFVCLEDECPLCGIGDTPRPKAAFSVVNLSAEEPVAEILLTSPTLTRQLAAFDQDPKTGPLDRIYWSMSRQGRGTKTVYTVIPVKPRDLSEDWSADANEIETTISRFEPLTPAVISFAPRDEMTRVAREISSR